MPTVRIRRGSRFGLAGFCLLAGCGSPPAPAASPAPVVTTSKEAPVDLSPVPEPEGLFLLGRVRSLDSIVRVAGGWTKLPLPTGTALAQAIAEESLADVIDVAQPVDVAMTITPASTSLSPHLGFSVAVKNFDQAKAKLGASHALTAGANGQVRLEGLSVGPGGDSNTCVLAPAVTGARLICGPEEDSELLASYMSRTLPRREWASDVHLEVRPEPVREQVAAILPIAGEVLRRMQGSEALQPLARAWFEELIDLVTDTELFSLDGQFADSGIDLSVRSEFRSKRSTMARMATSEQPGGPESTAFWRLPADTDMAFFGRGVDRDLFERPRGLLGDALLDALERAKMPEAERRALKDLTVDRMLPLLMGSRVSARGFDAAALARAKAALASVKPDDAKAREEQQREVLEQAIGWNLLLVNEPIEKVGSVLKDAVTLWNRPRVSTWMRSQMPTKELLPRLRVAPVPAGVVLPKDTVHLEATLPRADLVQTLATTSESKPKTKKTPVSPIVLHVLAVPDGSHAWLAVGLDVRLLAQKVGASLASASTTASNTLDKVTGMERLHEAALTGGGFVTLRGLGGLAAVLPRSGFYEQLGALPHQGASPLITTSRSEISSAGGRVGASITSLHVSRATIEDVVKLVMNSH